MKIRDNIERVPMLKIFTNAWNPNEQAEFIYGKEVESIKTNGFLVPLLVRKIKKGYEIIDGEHRFRAAADLGFTELPVNNLGEVPDEIAKQLTLTMNLHGEARRDKLAVLLTELKSTVGLEEMIKNLPYTPIEIENLINQQPIDWSAIGTQGGLETGSENPTPTSEDLEDQNGSVDRKKPLNRIISISVPAKVYCAFFEQIDRINQVIMPEADPKACGSDKAIKVIIDVLAQTPVKALSNKGLRSKIRRKK